MLLASPGERWIGEKLFDIGVQGCLIFLAGENIVGALFDDSCGDGLLRSHGVDGDDGAFERQHVEQFGNGGDLIALGLHRPRRQHEPGLVSIGRNNMQSAGAALVPLRAAQRFAVDRHDARTLIANLRLQARDPGRKGPLQRLRIERPQRSPQRLRWRDAVLKRQKTPQPVELFFAEHGDLVEVLHSAQKAYKDRKKNLVQRIGRHPGNAAVLNSFDIIQKTPAHRRALRRGNRIHPQDQRINNL
jgi:hypothetical protein